MSRYDRFRKRVAPIAFIFAMGLLIRETCKAPERYRATVVLQFGEAAPRIQQVDAELTTGDDVIGQFHRKALPGLPVTDMTFEVSMPEQRGSLRIDVNLGTEQRRVVRAIHVEEGSTVRVPLAADLAAPAPAP